MFKRIRLETSHAGHYRMLRSLDQDGDNGQKIMGWIRYQDMPIKSPYMFSQTRAVYSLKGDPVVIFETSHKRFEMFRVGLINIFVDEEAASEACKPENKS